MIEDEYELISDSLCSLSTRNPFHSSSMMKPLEAKKTMVRKKPSTFKPKAKKVVSDKPKKSVRIRRTKIDDLYDSIEDKCSVMERTEELMTSLTTAELPSFFKCMLPSNVAHGFWLILPKSFCDMHLPRQDATIILVDERGNEYKTNFLFERHGLSGGWRGFAIDHRLLKGDCLVFHLIEPCKLKVHIVRVYGLDEVDAALCLMNLEAFEKRIDSEEKRKKENNKKGKKGKKCIEHLFFLNIPRNYRTTSWNWSRVSSKLDVRLTTEDQFDDTSDGFCSEVIGDSEMTNHDQASNEVSY